MVANVANYKDQDTGTEHIGGTWQVESGGAAKVKSGGSMDIESGGALKVAGTDLTAEVAALASGAGATSGTAGASAHAGGGQGSATAITTAYTRFSTVATDGDSGVLPTAVLAKRITVKNDSANLLAVFPASGATINGGSTDASVTVQPGDEVTFTGTSGTNWETPEATAKLQGAQTLSGVQTFAKPNVYKMGTGITAGATQTQGGATALTAEFNDVTTVSTAGDGVKLLTAVAGQRQTVRNSGALALAVYPNTSDAIDAVSANGAVTLQPGEEVQFDAIDATTWRTNWGADDIASVTTSATPASGSNAAQFTFKNRGAVAVTGRRVLKAWLCDASGDPVGAATSIVKLTNGFTDQLITGKVVQAETSAAGLYGVTLTHAAGTYYMAFDLPNGRILVSGALVVNA